MEDLENLRKPHVTRHAIKRIRKRVGLRKKSTKALAKRALNEGLSRRDCTGHLRKYIDGVFFNSCSGNNIKVFNAKIFIFYDTVLITVISLPQSLAKIAKKILFKRKNNHNNNNNNNNNIV